MLNPNTIVLNTDAPNQNDEPVFKTPWEARIFALTAQLAESKKIEWDDFKENLIACIARADEIDNDCNDTSGTSYYRAWLQATERLLSDSQTCSPQELQDRIHDLQHPEASGKKSPTGSNARPVTEV